MGLLEENNVVLVITDSLPSIAPKDIVGQLSRSRRVAVFALAKPPVALMRELKGAGLREEQLHFIDAVAGCKGVKACTRVTSVEDLTSLSIAYTEAMNKGCDSALLSALTVMYTYVPENDLVKFAAAIAEKTRAFGAHILITTSWNESNQAGLRELFPFMDQIVDLRAKA